MRALRSVQPRGKGGVHLSIIRTAGVGWSLVPVRGRAQTVPGRDEEHLQGDY